MKFYVVIDPTGHPVVMGDQRLTRALAEGMELDVSDAHDSYDDAMQAVAEMRAARSANVPEPA